MWREAWADMVNARFEEKGLDCRIDHRSYVDQGLDLIPTVHEVYWSSFLVTLCSEIMLYIETPLVSYSYSLNEVSHSCTS